MQYYYYNQGSFRSWQKQNKKKRIWSDLSEHCIYMWQIIESLVNTRSAGFRCVRALVGKKSYSAPICKGFGVDGSQITGDKFRAIKRVNLHSIKIRFCVLFVET